MLLLLPKEFHHLLVRLNELYYVNLGLASINATVIASLPKVDLTLQELGNHLDFFLLSLQLFEVRPKNVRLLGKVGPNLSKQVLKYGLEFLLLHLSLILQRHHAVHNLFHLIPQQPLLLVFGLLHPRLVVIDII